MKLKGLERFGFMLLFSGLLGIVLVSGASADLSSVDDVKTVDVLVDIDGELLSVELFTGGLTVYYGYVDGFVPDFVVETSLFRISEFVYEYDSMGWLERLGYVHKYFKIPLKFIPSVRDMGVFG